MSALTDDFIDFDELENSEADGELFHQVVIEKQPFEVGLSEVEVVLSNTRIHDLSELMCVEVISDEGEQ